MLFLDMFAYSRRQESFPTIYIRDPSEDVCEVKETVLLSFNIERESSAMSSSCCSG